MSKKPWTIRIADRLNSMSLLWTPPAPGGEPELSRQAQRDQFAFIKKNVARSELVVADQVADYVFTISPKDYWADADLDCCVPPFPSTWVEWRWPMRINIDGHVKNDATPARAFGALVLCDEISETLTPLSDVELYEVGRQLCWQLESQFGKDANLDPQLANFKAALKKVKGDYEKLPADFKMIATEARMYSDCCDARSWRPLFNQPKKGNDELRNGHVLDASIPGVRWKISAHGLIEHKDGRASVWPMFVTAFLNSEGCLAGNHLKVASLTTGLQLEEGSGLAAYRKHLDLLEIGNTVYRVTLLAISMMHCKNVVYRTSTPPEALSKRYQRRTGQQLRSQRIIHVPQIAHLFDQQGRVRLGAEEREVALHKVRAHFKTYTETKPLFGSVVGKYFWASHLRGKGSELTQHTYEVGMPELPQL